MEQDQQRLRLEGIIKKLRSVTLAVQIMPFCYTFLYLVAMVFYLFSDDAVVNILDTLFYVSPVVVVQFLILSRSLRLCKWHKIACSLPIVPQIMVILDRTLLFFSERAAEVSVAAMILMSVLLLIAAYNVFLK